MKLLKILLIFITTLILIIVGISIFTKTKLTVENAEFNPNYENIYPPNCFIIFENKKYLIQEVYKYKHKILSEYWFVASEGFAVRKFEFPFEMNYNNKQKKLSLLKYSDDKRNINFANQKFKISEIRNDTIISKIDDNKIILFIDE